MELAQFHMVLEKEKKKFFFANAIFIQIYFKNTYASTP